MKMRFPLVLFLSVIVLSGCFGRTGPAPVTEYGQSAGAGSVGAHTVLRGDTLYSIAQRYNVRIDDVKIANNLRAPYALAVGQRLKLPAPKTYRVRAGDTLYFLSYMFDVDVEQTAELNGISDALQLQPGRVLKLPSLAQMRAVQPRVPVKSVVSSVAPKPDKKPAQAQQVVKAQEEQTLPVKRVSKVHVKPPKRSSSKFLKPVEGKVVSSYGPKKSGLHNDGINIAAARGTPVAAAENGVVVYAGNGLKGSGNLVLVRHEDRWMTAYAHLDKINVKNGTVLKRGQKLGTVGSSGAVNSPQLHFEVRRGTEALNPKPYLGG